MRILVAGSLVHDTMVGPIASLEWETTTWVDRFASGIGGNGASTAYTLARLGGQAVLLAACGHDPAATAVLNALSAAGVDTARVERMSGSTAATIAVFHPDGRRNLLHTPGVGLHASFQIAPGAGHFHLANPFALPYLRRHGAELLDRAREFGMTTSLDMGWDRLGEWGRIIDPCLPYLDLLIANEAEAAFLSAPPPCPLIVKRGAAGCTVDGVAVPGYRVRAVDTTGAGDCFCGGLLAARARGWPLLEAARVANAAGALSVRQPGATAGLLDWEETLAWMAAYEPVDS